MVRKFVVTVTGEYLGRAIDLTFIGENKIRLIVQKLHILKAVPITNVDDESLLQIKRELEESLKQNNMKAHLFLVAATVDYKQYDINPDDILPACYEGGEVIILLRNRQWLKIPLEAIGASPDDINLIAKYNTYYQASLRTLQMYQALIRDYRHTAIRFAEYARRLEADLSAMNKTLTELQDAVGRLHAEINSLLVTIKNYEQYTIAKEKETEIWKNAYMEVIGKIKEVGNLVPKIIELVNKLATAQLEREVEFERIQADIAKLEETLEEIQTKIGLKKEGAAEAKSTEGEEQGKKSEEEGLSEEEIREMIGE